MNKFAVPFIVGALLAPAIGACTVVEHPRERDVVVRDAPPAQPAPPTAAIVTTPGAVVQPTVVVPATEVRTYRY